MVWSRGETPGPPPRSARCAPRSDSARTSWSTTCREHAAVSETVDALGRVHRGTRLRQRRAPRAGPARPPVARAVVLRGRALVSRLARRAARPRSRRRRHPRRARRHEQARGRHPPSGAGYRRRARTELATRAASRARRAGGQRARRARSGRSSRCPRCATAESHRRTRRARPVACALRSRGDLVADVAAAPGGKATAIGERVGAEGEVVALDVDAGRLRLIVEASARLGLERGDRS